MWKFTSVTRLLMPMITTQLTHSPSSIRAFSVLTTNMSGVMRNLLPTNNQLLQPTSVIIEPERGFKVKGRLRLRCKDCFYVRCVSIKEVVHFHLKFSFKIFFSSTFRIKDRMHVLCRTHGRHKQKQMIKHDKNKWILQDATQSKQRAWWATLPLVMDQLTL